MPPNGFIHGHYYDDCMGFLLYPGCVGSTGMNCLIMLKKLVVVQGLAVWSPIFGMPWMIAVSLTLGFEVRNIPEVINAMMRVWLDHCACSLAWRQLFPKSNVVNLPFWRSDHRLVLLEVKEGVPDLVAGGRGLRRQFHYEQCWVEDEGYQNIILQAWKVQGGGLSGVSANIEQCSGLATCDEIGKKQKELLGLSSDIDPQAWLHIHQVKS
ncbi:hypothetical protein ACOSP7_009770 [Xanthoceras sorbifolium]